MRDGAGFQLCGRPSVAGRVIPRRLAFAGGRCHVLEPGRKGSEGHGTSGFRQERGQGARIGTADAAEARRAEALKKEIESNGLDASGLTVETSGDTVVLKGRANSQEEKEKAIIAVGNIAGVARVDEAVEVPDAKEGVYHTVVKGDNLWKIAEKYLGSGARNKEIFEANRRTLRTRQDLSGAGSAHSGEVGLRSRGRGGFVSVGEPVAVRDTTGAMRSSGGAGVSAVASTGRRCGSGRWRGRGVCSDHG